MTPNPATTPNTTVEAGPVGECMHGINDPAWCSLCRHQATTTHPRATTPPTTTPPATTPPTAPKRRRGR
jgi:hypothetical protein